MLEIRNPYNGDVLFQGGYESAEEVDAKLNKLHQARASLAKLLPFQRAEILERLVEILNREKSSIADCITREMGKSITESLVEVERSKITVKCSADESRRIAGELLPTGSYTDLGETLALVKRVPLGIVLAITPFNFPFNLALHKIAPAFASGNSILLKPGPQNYLSAKKLVELCHEAGMDENHIQLIMPDIPELSQLITDERIQCISFTGGTVAAKAIAKQAGTKKLLLELGGNDPFIVLPGSDLDKASEIVISQRFGTSGQRCTAPKRILVHSEIRTQFEKKLIEKTKTIKVGDPLDPATVVGPVVNQQAALIVESRIKDSVGMGAKCLIGGKREGNIIWPTILSQVTMEMPVVSDETFGPVVSLLEFNDLEECIEIVNSSQYGLQAGVMTNDIQVAKELYARLEVGALIVNNGPGFRAEHLPFGGIKSSGLGREGIRYAIEEMSALKTLVL